MNETEINWTEFSWNPLSGCTKISPGCNFCYASTWAERHRGTPAFPKGFDITLRPWKLDEPKKIKRPSLIFANSMSDFFHDEVPDTYRDAIFNVMRETPRHRFQVLTKRPEAMARYFATRPVPENAWMGITVENQAAADHRIPILAALPAKVRFLSIEPLLGPIRLPLVNPKPEWAIHWAIVGGESGNHLSDAGLAANRALVVKVRGKFEPRYDRSTWVRDLRDQCGTRGIAFWFKQWGGLKGPAAGRLLDGRTWDELPKLPGALPEGYVHRENSQLTLGGA